MFRLVIWRKAKLLGELRAHQRVAIIRLGKLSELPQLFQIAPRLHQDCKLHAMLLTMPALKTVSLQHDQSLRGLLRIRKGVAELS